MYILVALCNRIHLQPNALRMRHILTQSQLVCHSFMCHETLFHCNCWRPYHVECTGSLLTSEVKRHRARLVLGWGTAWEDLRVLPAQNRLKRRGTGKRGRRGGGRGRGQLAPASASASILVRVGNSSIYLPRQLYIGIGGPV